MNVDVHFTVSDLSLMVHSDIVPFTNLPLSPQRGLLLASRSRTGRTSAVEEDCAPETRAAEVTAKILKPKCAESQYL